MQPKPPTSLARDYTIILPLLAAVVGLLIWITRADNAVTIDAKGVVGPMVAMVALTGVVWILMVIFRNVAVIRGATTTTYFRAFRSGPPAEWIERPARAFDNLCQVPLLFHVGCLLVIATDTCDLAMVHLGWLFVATRVVHAFIFIVLNVVPYRFASYAAGCMTLGVLWGRIALQLV